MSMIEHFLECSPGSKTFVADWLSSSAVEIDVTGSKQVAEVILCTVIVEDHQLESKVA